MNLYKRQLLEFTKQYQMEGAKLHEVFVNAKKTTVLIDLTSN